MFGSKVIQGEAVATGVPQDYIAFYPLTGTAEDVTGNYNGTEVSMTYVDDATKGSMGDFPRDITKYITNLDHSVALNATGNYSYVGTIQVNDLLDYAIPWGTYAAGFYNYFIIYTDGTLRYDISDTGGGTTNIVPNPAVTLVAGTLYHIAFTLSGLDYALYADGAVIASGTLAVAAADVQSHFVIGGGGLADGTPSSDSEFAGQVSGLRVYDRTLTAAEITTIYNYESTTKHIPVSDGLVAYYPLESNSMDNYFNQYDGVDTAPVVYDGVSANFDGLTSSIASGYKTTTSTIFTAAVWFTSTNTAVAVNTFFGDSDSGGTSVTFILGTYDSNFYVRIQNGATDWYDLSTVSAVPYLDGLPHHAVFTANGTTVLLYIDGVLLYTYTSTTAMGEVGVDFLTMGAFGPAYTAGHYFSGDLSDGRIYHRDITAAEVTAIYDAEKVKYGL